MRVQGCGEWGRGMGGEEGWGGGGRGDLSDCSSVL